MSPPPPNQLLLWIFFKIQNSFKFFTYVMFEWNLQSLQIMKHSILKGFLGMHTLEFYS
jgi:hypothetical protein